MKRKINGYLTGLSVVVVLLTAVCLSFVFYGLFERQVRSDLLSDAELLKAAGISAESFSENQREDEVFSRIEEEAEDVRLTLIAKDGVVLYDSSTDAALLENHADRPEVADAFLTGSGESRRRSDTMGKNTFYCAILLDDGSVLRLAEETDSLFRFFFSAVPVILLILAVILAASAFISHLLTRQLLAPINKMAQNIEDTSGSDVYEELVPFVNTIREQHEDILSAAKSRQDFTANVSHELKTPLTAISGYAELIENHMADPGQEAEFAEKIQENADRLVSLINDIIRLSEIDGTEQEEMSMEEFDLSETVQSVADLSRVNADKKHVTLNLDLTSTILPGNKNMIFELTDNLVQNAIQYNVEGGEVTISVKKESGRPVLTVKDTGIGIPKEQQDRVFERFFRVDKSRSRQTGGTGLGLAIVKHIAELHNAEIKMESEVGKGTCIKVVF